MDVRWQSADRLLGFWGEIALILALVGVGLAVLSLIRKGRYNGRPLSVAVLILAGLGSAAFFLTFTPAGPELLGPPPVRLVEFVGLPLVPVLAYTLAWTSRVRTPRLGSAAVAIAVGGFLIASSIGGVSSNQTIQDSLSTPAYLFTPAMLAASEWLAQHAAPGSVIGVDQNAGNTALVLMRDFTEHAVIVRPRTTLYASILGSHAPENLSAYYANLVMTDPTLANAQAAYRNLSLEYYVFQYGFSDQQIAAFSLLSYFPMVYANSQVAVFQLTGDGLPGFVPATSYCAASASVERFDLGARAYSYAFSMATGLSAIGSATGAGSSFDGSNVTYCLNAPSSGSYRVYVHRYTYDTTEYLNLSIDGKQMGEIHATTLGPNVGTPLTVRIPAGPVDLFLTFEGTVGWADPVDYLVVSPA